MRRKPIEFEPWQTEKGLPAVLAKARASLADFLSRPDYLYEGQPRIKLMYPRRILAFERILGALVERTQLAMGGLCYELFRDINGQLTYRPLNVDDLLRLTGLSRPAFYRAWKELQKAGLVVAEKQERRCLAQGEFLVTDVLRGLSEKFWEVIGIGVEVFKEACTKLPKSAAQLVSEGINAGIRTVQRITRRVFSSPVQAAAAKAQEDLSQLRLSLAREGAKCRSEKRARGEDPLKCFGCKKSCSKHCQLCLNEERAKAAAGELGYKEAGALALQQKAEADSLRVARIQLGLF